MIMQQAKAENQQKINNNTGDVSSSNALNKLKRLINKYKNVMIVVDKNCMDFFDDSLDKKI